MSCPDCDGAVITFSVPADLGPLAADALGADSQTAVTACRICPTCLRVEASEHEPAEPPSFDRITESFPTGEAGATFAVLLATLPSVATRRDAASRLRAETEQRGGDPHLAFDRLIAAADRGEIDPAFDLRRRVRQLESLLDS